MQNVFFNDEVLSAEKEIYTSLDIPSLILMENAGANSARFIKENYPDEIKNEVIILTGKGNNAGDGFVIARHLSNKNISVKILMLYPERDLKGDAYVNFSILKNSAGKLIKCVYCKDDKILKKEITPGNVILIDAIFGVGFKGELEKRIRNIIESINEFKDKVVISVDTPSGLFNYNQDVICINADITLTMGVKKFHSLFYKGRESSKKIEVINIGISSDEFTEYNPKRIFEVEEKDVKGYLPTREINSNKYSNGKVFILSGSKGITGAAYLCSLSALRTGSGAVITGVPKSLNNIMEVKLTEVMTMSLSETNESTLSLECYDEIKTKLKWADTVLLGPGLSKNQETLDLVRKIVTENNLNYVIDADGISAFKGNLNLLKNRKIILTPHIGEFSNLIGKNSEEVKNNFYKLAKSFAKDYKIILVLKNSPATITDSESFYINSTGRENLATVGTGDVLSGIISSLYSQTGDALGSAISGVYLHGMCGDSLYNKTGASSTIAGDLIAEIPAMKNRLSGT